MRSYDVVVIGGINTDYVGRAELLPQPGQTVNGDRFFETPGGKGANQAVAAARLGASVALIAAIGSDIRGRELVQHLHREGVATGSVVELAEQATGAALILIDSHGDKQILSVPGANRALTSTHVEQSWRAVSRARVVLAQLEVPLHCVDLAFDLGRRDGAFTILDPAPPQVLTDALLQKVDVIRPNAHEAEAATLAHAAAALATTEFGAQHPEVTESDLLEFLKGREALR